MTPEDLDDDQGIRVPKINSQGKVKVFKCKQCEVCRGCAILRNAGFLNDVLIFFPVCGRDQGGFLEAYQNAHQTGEDAQLPKMSVCHRIQTPLGIPSAKPLWIQALQMSILQLYMRQQEHVKFAHEESYKHLSIQMSGLQLRD